ncbi:MAG TPA: SBBP repeat-containing protein, partial [Bryobacteraceae bacterium]
GVTQDPTGSIFVTGYTRSTDFPAIQGAQTTLQGTEDAFLTKLTGTFGQVQSMFLGTTGINFASGVTFVPASGPTGAEIDVSGTTVDTKSDRFLAEIWRLPISGTTYQTQNLDDLLPPNVAPQLALQITQLGPQLAVIVNELSAPVIATHNNDTYNGNRTSNESICLTAAQGSTSINDVHIKGNWIASVRPTAISPEPYHADVERLNPPDQDLVEFTADFKQPQTLQPGTSSCVSVPIATLKDVPAHMLVGLTQKDSGGHDAWVGLVDAAPAGTTQAARLRPQQAAPQSHAGVLILNRSPDALTLSFWGDIHGNGSDTTSGLAADPQGNLYISGATSSTQFPLLEPAQAGYGGGTFDGYVLKLANTTPVPASQPSTATPTATATATATPTPTARKCPKHSTAKGAKCACKKGYTLKKGKCVKKK